MADTYSYPLLVELPDGNIPKLKNKLVKYFQSKKSNGGDCEVDYEPGSRTAVLRFRREEDQRNVLAKAAHQISLDKGVIKMTVHLPSEEKKTQETPSEKGNKYVAVTIKESKADEPNPADPVQTEEKGKEADAADEELCSTSAVLENLSERGSEEFLQMLVENILKAHAHSSASQGFNLEIIPEISSAVVTFQSGKVNADFIAQCPQNKMFTKLNFSVRPLEVTKQVVVENIQNTNVDMLQLYFESEGGDVDDLNLNEAEQSAVITFEDCQAVQKVLKKKHHIKNEDIKVYPFYKSLGVALYGKDQPSLKLPAATSEPIDSDIWRYLTNNQAAAQSVRSDMAKHFCDVNLDQSTVRLSPLSLLLKQKDAKATMKDWTTTVKSAFAQAMSKFKSLKFPVESEVWEKSEEKIRQSLLNEDVLVVSEKSSGVLSVVGLVNDVNRQEKTVSEALNKINQTVQREKTVKTQEIKVPPSIFHILSQDGLQDKLLRVSPELKTHYDKEAAVLKVTGLFNEIFEVSKIINDGILGFKRGNLEVDTYVFDMMKDEQQEELTSALLTSVGINAALEISAQRVQLVALSDKDLLHGQDHLRRFLISQYIDVEDVDVLKKPEWQVLVGQLENDNNKKCRITQSPQKVVVSGHKDSVEQVSSELSSFLTQNAHVETTVDVKANVIIDYIKSLDMSWLKDWEDKVAVSFRKEAIFLSGSRASVEQIKILLEDVVASVSFDILRLSKPGVKKLFKDKDSMLLSTIRRDTGCLVQLVDEDGDKGDDWASVQVQKPVYQIKTQDGVEIAVCKADMCSYPVDAVVNASTPALKHSAGLAAALVKAAGPQLQAECDRIVSKGQLKPGDCVITGAGGQLCCQKIIHAVGPKYIKTPSHKAEAQLRRTIKNSLELAETHGCTSVALPAVGRGQGFPLDLCVATVVKAVKDYYLEKYDTILKMIHLVDNDDSVVQAMEGAVKQEFGSHSVVNSPQPLTTKVSKSPPVKRAVDDSCLCRVQTKEGLDIILTKGNIEASTMEVIVNTVSEDFDLTKGAVSRVILAAAGPRLQQMVAAQDPRGAVGEVVVTDGCNLKSQNVYHTVAPRWDKGKSTAKKTLCDILNRCLDLAESNHMSSISFPAIGTGNLGFPKDLVASLMLEKILAFSSQNHPKNLKKVVIVLYPTDAETIKEFSDEFMKKFPSAAHGSLAPNKVQSPAGPFSNVASSSGMHETKLGNVTIQAVTADITQETTDVIVNSSNADFSLKSGVSKAILEAAGQAVEQECRNLAAQPNPGMIMTQPGNLKCKKILHLIGTTDTIKINKSVKEALEMCLKTSHTSVSFPAIGTGQGNVQARQVADSMLDAVIEVLSQNTSSTLTTVRIVVFQPHMLKDFSDSMHQRGHIDAKDKGGAFMQFWGKLKTILVGKTTESPDKKEDFVIVTVQGDPTCFHICGGRQAEVDSAKKRITDLISMGQTSVLVTDSSISNMGQADIQQLIDIQKKLGVVIRSEIMNGQHSLIIEGLQKDVFEVKCAVYDMLKKVREVEEMKRNMALAGRVADWQYEQSGQFISFDAMANFQLEQACEESKPRITIKVQGQVYTVVLPNGPATDSQGNVLKIRRNDKLKGQEVPVSWDPMPTGTTCLPFLIQPGTPEHTDVLNLFQVSCKRPITKIERIQNPTLWKAYQAKKQDLELRNKHQNNEKRLFHGTCESTASKVNELGFNRSYAGMNAAAYGNGTYFAVNASYSASDTYSKPNSNGEKIMYLCRVLTGDFCKGKSGMIDAPTKGTSSVETYNSVVDNEANPIIFVIFHDNQAYPEYMITFQ
ncbi:poly(ADP-ribose) polymerase family member 14-related sequence 1 isoform X2 [Cololabis saira]|uniref:poly(ADP-ribose) polymerase family member 14-related sequence 1 isoform X2 n=1 Tax=Cololabis saira TaxID=129043 RepID=UPI002AD49362|nr:poly(ADP-ribose) polymerase family member 14-related sequence 1 isoform X2 [Cololabis saira]